MKQLLKGNIQIVDEVKDWKTALEIASQPLIEKGKIETRYIDAMIETICKLGPYIVMIPKVAMPHARPEDGVNETSLSLLKLNKAIEFSPEKNKVQLILILAAKDNSSHVNVIVEIMNFIENDSLIDKVISCQSVYEIEKLLLEEE